ncbi:MAG: adenylate/guanylate cyclase domain-containing protein [Solirubrobacteraceae bacterium]
MRNENRTFLFADLVGFTNYTESAGDEAAADLATSFCAEAARLAACHRAETIKSIGDEVMICGADPAETVRLGVRIVDELTTILPIRVGMHTGAAVHRAGDWFGSAVNVASRVACAAGAGEILITDATRRTCAALGDIALEPVGPMEFKNVAGLVDVSAVRSWIADPGAASGAGRSAAFLQPALSAVPA